MQDLLKINYETEEPTVSARELYDRLNIKSNFTTWFRRMCEYGFEDGKDFFPKMEESTGGRPTGAFALEYFRIREWQYRKRKIREAKEHAGREAA